MNNTFTCSCLIVCALGLSLYSCSTESKQQTKELQSYKIVQPVILDTTFTREYIADLHSLQNVEIRTHVQGFIEKIHVDEGKPVMEGQIMFTLSSRVFRENLLKANAAHKSAIADLKVAEVELKNAHTLADKKIISRSEVEMAEAKKEAAEAKLEEARSAMAIADLNLSYTQVRAPFTGVINRIPYKTGSLVSEGDLLTTISNNKEIFAYFNVSEKEFLDMARERDMNRNEVRLLMANNDVFPEKGKIETAENEVDKSTGNIAFRARFQNPHHVLRHGSSGKILLKEELENAMIIPQKATFEIQDKVYVFTLDKNNIVRMRNIQPSIRLNHLFVIQSGLDASDRVIYEGIQQVKEGEQIRPQLITMRDALRN